MRKNLYRSNDDKILGGVCGGLAEYFEVSSTLVRLLWVLLIFIDGIGLLLYIVAWIIMPKKPVDNNKENLDTNNLAKKELSERNNFIIGLIFVLIGMILLLKNFIPNIMSYFNIIVGILFLVLGIYLVIKRR
ncbi:MAG: PspC domain-containing protein [Thermosipho sp. (in: Bacteria)]|nr:PspC domain-containing protein [Thermosipho sp. (in: thermotogales)]